jgi:hypothetical protein
MPVRCRRGRGSERLGLKVRGRFSTVAVIKGGRGSGGQFVGGRHALCFDNELELKQMTRRNQTSGPAGLPFGDSVAVGGAVGRLTRRWVACKERA